MRIFFLQPYSTAFRTVRTGVPSTFIDPQSLMPSPSASRDSSRDLDERSRILGLQLHAHKAQAQVRVALQAYDNESPSSIVLRHVQSGFLASHLKATEEQHHAHCALRDRLASSLSASSSSSSSNRGPSTAASPRGGPGGTVHVLGKARPRAHAAVAHEHLEDWCEQQSASLANLQVRQRAASCEVVRSHVCSCRLMREKPGRTRRRADRGSAAGEGGAVGEVWSVGCGLPLQDPDLQP